ncbi:amidohydrolase family protein [Cloacibacillus evryensis]
MSFGKAADVVVLDRNIFDIPTSELRNVKVLNTLLAGRSVYGSISRWT